MSNGLNRALEKASKDFLTTNKLEKPFYLVGTMNPLKIIAISQAIPDLNLANEEIIFCYDKRVNNIFSGFVLTDKYLHWVKNGKGQRSEIFKIADELTENDFKDIFDKNEKPLLNKVMDFLTRISRGQFNEKSFREEIPTLEKQTPAKDIPIVIDETYIQDIQSEGGKLKNIIDLLEKDKDFMTGLQTSLLKSDTMSDDFKPYHVVIQDIITIFNKISGVTKNETISLKGQFVLAYLFECMQGNDMAESLSMERINELVQNEKFGESIQKLRDAQFLKVPDEYRDQLILPSLLQRLENTQLQAVGTHYHRIASLIAKANDTISPPEEEMLKTIYDLCLNPRKNLANVKQTAVPENETLEDVMKELNELVGLKNIKNDINDLINYLKVQKMREVQKLATTERTLHSVFMGPPGTGKTTIARLIGRIFKHLGYLESGHIVETDRAGLVAGFVGQTALKVDEVVKSALNGVLFIDEAYALAKDEFGRDFGHEAIEALLKRMEDNRDNLVVIAAGYPDEMKTFIESNPGLQSRFNRYFTFDHYTAQEMLEIFKGLAKKSDFVIAKDAEEKLSFIFEGLYAKRNRTFGNARVVRNIFEQCMALQANRIVSITPITKEILMKLQEADIPDVNETIKKVLVFDQNIAQKPAI